MRFITSAEVCEMLGISRKTFDSHTKRLPGFPKPLVLSPKVIRWNTEAIQRWLEAQVKAT